MNSVHLMGRLTADPDFRKTPTGISVCTFTLAVDKGYKGEDGKRQSDFFRCVAWKNTAEFISKYFEKGQMASLSGKLKNRDYIDKKDNIKRYVTEVIVKEIFFTGGKKAQADNINSIDGKDPSILSPESSEFADIDIDDGELPF